MVIALIAVLAIAGCVIGALVGGGINYGRFGGSGLSVLGTPALFAGACVMAAGGFGTALTLVGVAIAGIIFGLMFRGAAK